MSLFGNSSACYEQLERSTSFDFKKAHKRLLLHYENTWRRAVIYSEIEERLQALSKEAHAQLPFFVLQGFIHFWNREEREQYPEANLAIREEMVDWTIRQASLVAMNGDPGTATKMLALLNTDVDCPSSEELTSISCNPHPKAKKAILTIFENHALLREDSLHELSEIFRKTPDPKFALEIKDRLLSFAKRFPDLPGYFIRSDNFAKELWGLAPLLVDTPHKLPHQEEALQSLTKPLRLFLKTSGEEGFSTVVDTELAPPLLPKARELVAKEILNFIEEEGYVASHAAYDALVTVQETGGLSTETQAKATQLLGIFLDKRFQEDPGTIIEDLFWDFSDESDRHQPWGMPDELFAEKTNLLSQYLDRLPPIAAAVSAFAFYLNRAQVYDKKAADWAKEKGDGFVAMLGVSQRQQVLSLLREEDVLDNSIWSRALIETLSTPERGQGANAQPATLPVSEPH